MPDKFYRNRNAVQCWNYRSWSATGCLHFGVLKTIGVNSLWVIKNSGRPIIFKLRTIYGLKILFLSKFNRFKCKIEWISPTYGRMYGYFSISDNYIYRCDFAAKNCCKTLKNISMIKNKKKIYFHESGFHQMFKIWSWLQS